MPIQLTADERADLERRCDQFADNPPGDMKEYAEACREPGLARELWLAGEWLYRQLIEHGASRDQAADICFANGQRTAGHDDDVWNIAETSLAKFIAGTPDKPGAALAQEIMDQQPEEMQAVRQVMTLTDTELKRRVRAQADWVEAMLADGQSRSWSPHLTIWRKPGFGDGEQTLVISDFGNFNTDDEKWKAMMREGRKLADLPGAPTCVILSAEAWMSSDPKFHGGPDGQQPKDDPEKLECIFIMGLAVVTVTGCVGWAPLTRAAGTDKIRPVKFGELTFQREHRHKLLDWFMAGFMQGMESKLRRREQELEHEH